MKSSLVLVWVTDPQNVEKQRYLILHTHMHTHLSAILTGYYNPEKPECSAKSLTEMLKRKQRFVRHLTGEKVYKKRCNNMTQKMYKNRRWSDIENRFLRKTSSSSVRILNSFFAMQNGEFIDRFSNSRWSRALNRSSSRKLSACRSIMRPRFLCTTTRADRAMAAGRFELYRVYSTVYTSDSKQCWRNRHQNTPISVFFFFFSSFFSPLRLHWAEYDARIWTLEFFLVFWKSWNSRGKNVIEMTEKGSLLDHELYINRNWSGIIFKWDDLNKLDRY